MKNIFKATLAVAVVAAVGMGVYKTYNFCVLANLNSNDLLIAENIEALADDGDGIKVNVHDRKESTTDISFPKYDGEGNYVGDSIYGYNHVVTCVGKGVTPCTPGSDTHIFSDSEYQCTIGK